MHDKHRVTPNLTSKLMVCLGRLVMTAYCLQVWALQSTSSTIPESCRKPSCKIYSTHRALFIHSLQHMQFHIQSQMCFETSVNMTTTNTAITESDILLVTLSEQASIPCTMPGLCCMLLVLSKLSGALCLSQRCHAGHCYSCGS